MFAVFTFAFMCLSNDSWPSKVTPLFFCLRKRVFFVVRDNEKSNVSSIFLLTCRTLHYLGQILIATYRSMFVGDQNIFVVFPVC